MPEDAPKWTVTAWHCSCHAVEWRRRTPSPPGRPPAPGVPAGVGGGLFWYDTVDKFLADGHRDLKPVDVSNVAALLADFHEAEKLRAEVEAHEGELGDMRAALSAAEADRDREFQRAEGWADQYNRVARQIADLRGERDTALADAKQARADARDSQADEVQRLDALLQTVTAERDRRGDELRRAQALVSLLSKRIAVLRAEADEEFCTCGSYDCHGECCGVGNCTCTTNGEAPVPP